MFIFLPDELELCSNGLPYGPCNFPFTVIAVPAGLPDCNADDRSRLSRISKSHTNLISDIGDAFKWATVVLVTLTCDQVFLFSTFKTAFKLKETAENSILPW